MKKSEVIQNQIDEKKETLSKLDAEMFNSNFILNPDLLDKKNKRLDSLKTSISQLEIAKSEAVQQEEKEVYQRKIDAKNIALNTPNWKLEILRGFFMPLAVSIIGTVTTTMILFSFGLLGK